LAGGEVAEGEVAEADAVEREHGRARRGEHAADLVVFALGENQVGGARGVGEEREFGGGAGGVFSVEDERAGGEEGDEVGREIAVGGGAVEFGDFVLGRGVFVDEFGLVGEEDQAGGVLIEAADAGDLGIAGAPAFGEEVVNARAFAFVVGADEAEGFVEQEENAVGVVERFAVDEDVGGMGFGGRVADGGAFYGDGVFFEEVAGLAAGAVTEVGEELVEATHRETEGKGHGVGKGRVRGRLIAAGGFGRSEGDTECTEFGREVEERLMTAMIAGYVGEAGQGRRRGSGDGQPPYVGCYEGSASDVGNRNPRTHVRGYAKSRNRRASGSLDGNFFAQGEGCRA